MAQPTKKNEQDKEFTSKSGDVATHVNTEKEMTSEKPGLRSVKQEEGQGQGISKRDEEEDEEVLGQEDKEEGPVRNFRDNQKSTDKGSRDNTSNI